jgi:cyanophycin synthetase
VKRIVVEVARDTAVLSADDALCLKMADYTSAKHLCYVTMDPTHELVGEHIRAGGRGVVLESGIKGQMITIYDHGAHIPLLWTHLIPATLEGRALHNVQNAMFAAAMAFSMGLKLEEIRHGLRTFDTTFFQAPGRMNIYDEHQFKVILDYGHNPAAVRAMASLVSRLDVKGKRVCVLAAPGDRRDADIAEIARHAAPAFDQFIIRQDDGLRGRASGEVADLLRSGLLQHGVAESKIQIILDEQRSIDAALAACDQGDLLLIFGDNISRCWKQIVRFREDRFAPAARAAATSSVGQLAVGLPSNPTGHLAGQPAGLTGPVNDDRPVEDRSTPSGVVEDARGVRLARDAGLDD